MKDVKKFRSISKEKFKDLIKDYKKKSIFDESDEGFSNGEVE